MTVPIPGYEGLYEIDDLGNVFSLRTGKKRKAVFNKATGYEAMVLVDLNGSKKTITVHRLVASAFIPNPENLECVNHKNEDKTDNRVENLEWCSKYYNNTYNGKAKRCSKPIVMISADGIETVFPSAREAANFGYSNYRNISAVCRGLRPRAYGMRWRFLNG